VKRKVFKLRNDADDMSCSITLRSAGGVSFQSAGLLGLINAQTNTLFSYF